MKNLAKRWAVLIQHKEMLLHPGTQLAQCLRLNLGVGYHVPIKDNHEAVVVAVEVGLA
jgi:hypothetical protein